VQSIVKCSNFHKHSLYVGIWNSNSSVRMQIFIVTGKYTLVLSLPLSLVQLKGKGYCTMCHGGTEWEGGRAETSLYPYTSLAQKGVCGQPHALIALPLGGIQYKLYKKLGGPQSCSGEHGISCLHQGSHDPTHSK